MGTKWTPMSNAEVMLLPHAINFNDPSPKSEESLPKRKRGFGTNLGKNNYGVNLSKVVLSLFQTHSILDSSNWSSGHLDQQLNYDSHPMSDLEWAGKRFATFFKVSL